MSRRSLEPPRGTSVISVAPTPEMGAGAVPLSAVAPSPLGSSGFLAALGKGAGAQGDG